MNDTLKDITGYIDFLRKHGWCVMLSCFGNNFGDCLPVRLEYEVHQPNVCVYLKSNPSMRGKCIHNKRMLEKKSPSQMYYSHCYAGVEEYVYPVIYERKMIICVSISGYRGKNERSELCAEVVRKRCGQRFFELYSELSADVPDEEEIKRMIKPLEYMLRELYRKCAETAQTETPQKIVFRKAITYIYENYACKITCADVARAAGYSEVHLRHIFREECRSTIMEYINNVRMSRAAEMLRSTAYGVTDVAFACGFEDSNYFSTAFKKKYGVPPKIYRRRNSEA